MKELSRQERVHFILKRDGAHCVICDKPFMPNSEITIDHWIPKAAGGSDDLENLRLAHKKCNVWKGDRVPNEDGSLPPKPPKNDFVRRKESKKLLKSLICHKCNNGRLLKQNEICKTCNSPAGPEKYPHWAKRDAIKCTHTGIEWCWACSIGWVERAPLAQLVRVSH